MQSNNDFLTENDIRTHLSGKLSGLPVFVYKEIDSTNNEAKKKIAEDGITEALFITTHQTAGRGRRGHNFYSPVSGVYFSYVFTPDSLNDAPHSTTKAAVCVAQAINELYGVTAQIKWVNDIFLNGKKVCGILTEAVTSGVNKGSVVVGIGINFSSANKIPDEIKDVMGFLPSKDDVSKAMLAGRIISLLADETDRLSDREYIKKYRKASMLTGKNITYYENDVLNSAFVLDVDEDAGLIVKKQDGSVVTLRNGEVFSVREV